eukprot:CAMPEP_0183410058 /NCGR_PEP_ID=MMETSP0370-20130417/19303_1 /TAXON_ID=268820 /ORGANISM="Peridinium aciculiferum, Strain PAER-2" /LENGTH=66 /DNA_ID=CAMNT_0025592841 /DNA_START=18 /DNA_END=214 /DNA_ORIENTATION=+
MHPAPRLTLLEARMAALARGHRIATAPQNQIVALAAGNPVRAVAVKPAVQNRDAGPVRVRDGLVVA